MCGIVGFIDNGGIDQEKAFALGKKMMNAISHRGPDKGGVWCESSEGLVLAHRRLSIVDLSDAGDQPMMSSHGRYVIVFNGEIYNHLAIRKQLDAEGLAPTWSGHSDTETILAAVEAYGLEKSLQKFVGMFAFALWDKKQRSLYLARDRVGEKPLYFGEQDNILFFSSELKALRKHPNFVSEVNRDALCLYLRHNYIPQPHTIYKNVFKLPPGNFVKLEKAAEPKPYWSLVDVISNNYKTNTLSDNENLEILENALKEAVRLQMQSDVPLGAFLSGGVDSSLIVALMQEQSSKPVKSFSIGFENKEFNEAPFAKAVASHFQTDHHELYVTSKQARDVITELPKLFDEPFSDSSQIPTYLVSKLAKQHVTVALSGDAGDELFGGYNRYHFGSDVYNKMSIFPRAFRQLISSSVTTFSPTTWTNAFNPVNSLLPKKIKQKNFGDRLHKFCEILGVESENEFYRILISHWSNPNSLVKGGREPENSITISRDFLEGLPFAEQMMFFDTLTYLPDDILVKVDRASMGVSLETRAPFLDHRIIELAWQLPLHLKINNGQGKYCLREILFKRIPRSLIERPKMGFGVPLADWIRGPLYDWSEHLLDENRLKQSGYFDVKQIRAKFSEHISGKRNWQYHLWDILMFEAWRDEVGQ